MYNTIKVVKIMKEITDIQIIKESNEEILPDFSNHFSYLASRVQFDHYINQFVPWHYHHVVELFYIESGALEYTTPTGKYIFTKESGGFINSNVLHSTKVISSNPTIQLIHLFDPELISNSSFNQINQKYILPLISSNIDIIPFHPDGAYQSTILKEIRQAFNLDETTFGYELKIRNELANIWLMLLEHINQNNIHLTLNKNQDERIKILLEYIHTHFYENIQIEQLAHQANISKRECYRLFKKTLNTSPIDYITHYRLQKAKYLLLSTLDPITQIAYQCGFSSSSYFSKTFKEYFSCTPNEFRNNWHNNDTNRHK